MAPRYPRNAAFMEARNYRRAPGENLPVTRIVIHDMEMAEKGDTAESCAALFAGSRAPQASAHFCVDADSVIQCVDIDRVAWHAPPNPHSVGIEHAGFANQKMGDWLDAYGRTMIDRSAALCAWLCDQLAIPARWLTVNQVRAGEAGLCTHADVSAAFHQTDHTDPGPDFPKDHYLDRLKVHLANPGGSVSTAQPTLTEIQSGILYYGLDKAHVNPLTMISRTYDMVIAQTGILKALQQAEDEEDSVDIDELAHALVKLLPDSVISATDLDLLSTAIADKLAARQNAPKG